MNLSDILQRGPGGAPHATIHQCRQCRRFARTPAVYEHAVPESPELLGICLKHIPALQQDDIKLMDASWIWTEPHSMRLKLRLTVRTELQNVPVEQRVMVEQHVQFKMCKECQREYTNRTWQALVQVRQDCVHKKGLATLEMALARNPNVRKHVLKIDTAKNGFDFYFLSNVHAQLFTQFLTRIAAVKVAKTTSKLVSTDAKNNTANIKTTTLVQMIPCSRDDLILVHKSVHKNRLAGRLGLVHNLATNMHMLDASPSKSIAESMVAVSPEAYYKDEKGYEILQTSNRMTRFVVLNMDMLDRTDSAALYEGPASGVEKYALAEATVAREADFGTNDDMFTCNTHLGHLIQAGDVVLGYDLHNLMEDDWEIQQNLHNHYVVPDVVLVKKVKGTPDAIAEQVDEAPQKRTTKKKERRKRLKEGKKMKELEESVVRMGFFAEENEDGNDDFASTLVDDPAMAAELSALEQQFQALETDDKEPPE